MFRKKKGYKTLTPDEFIAYMSEHLKGVKAVTYFKIQFEREHSDEERESLKLGGNDA